MSNLAALPARYFPDATGAPIPGAQMWFTLTGTNTPAAVYTTNALSVAHTNPVVADGTGAFPAIFLDPTKTYRARVYAAAATAGVDSALADYDPISTAEISTGDKGDVVVASGGGMTVESASPAGGVFQVSGAFKVVGGASLGTASGFGAAYMSAVNGLTVYGEGSSYDFSLASKAGLVVVRIPTGTQNADFRGNVSAAGTLGVTGATTFNDAALSVSPTAGIGYGTGAGGTVTQATSKATGVTLNKVCGQITLNNASLAASTTAYFTLTNSAIAATDGVMAWIASGATGGSYSVTVDAVAAGSCRIAIRNTSGGALGEAVVIGFAVIKAKTA